MKIVVVGTGYVGLVTGSCLAEVGTEVICIDVNVQKIENLQKGILPIYEPGLDEIVERNFKKGRLHFSTSLDEAIIGAQVVFIAVGTPRVRMAVQIFNMCCRLQILLENI